MGSNPDRDHGAYMYMYMCMSSSIIASLHPQVNGYLRGQSWLLCLISSICAEMAATELYTPQGAETVSGMIYAPDEQG